jgi:hypothetical protein
MVIGSIWYAKGTFGTLWMQLARLDEKKMAKQGMVKPIVTTLIVSFISAYVLAHMVFLAHHFFNNSYLWDAMSTAFWAWLGFTAARFITHDAFEGRPGKLTLLNISHEFVTFMVMGAIIGWLGV